MGRTRTAKARLSYLHAKKAHSEKRKKELISYLENLKQAYHLGQLPQERYVEIIHRKIKGRTIEEWIHYYHHEALYAYNEIQKHLSKKSKKRFIAFLSLTLIAVFLISFFGFAPVGFVFQDEDAIENLTLLDLSQELNLTVNATTIHELEINQTGNLTYLALSGSIQGDGQVKIYFEDILALDSSELEKEASAGTRTITGFSIDNETQEDQDQEQGQEQSDLSQTGEEEVNEEESSQTEDSSPSQDPELVSGDSQEDSSSSNQTRGIPETSPLITEPELETNQTSDTNQSQSDELNESEAPSAQETEDSSPSLEPDDSGSSQEQEEPTSSVTEDNIKTFEEYCKNTCTMKYNLDKDIYELRIEVPQGVTVNIDKIDYKILTEEPAINKTSGEPTQEEQVEETENITEPQDQMQTRGAQAVGDLNSMIYDDCNSANINQSNFDNQTSSGDEADIYATGTGYYILDSNDRGELTLHTSGLKDNFTKFTVNARLDEDLGDGRGWHFGIGNGSLYGQSECRSNTGWAPNNGYFVCFLGNDAGTQIYRVDNGVETQIASNSNNVDTTTYHNYTTELNESGIFFFIDSSLWINSSDTTYSEGYITISTGGGNTNRGNMSINNVWDYEEEQSIAPTHSTPILNSTEGLNQTDENLTCYNQSTSDINGEPIKNIYNWKKNSNSITLLNMPFEGGSNSTYTEDYSGNNNDGTVSGATWNSTAGYDGFGAYEFDGSTSYISLGEPAELDFTGTPNFTISARVKVLGNTDSHRPIVAKGDTQYTLKIYTDNKFEACAYDGAWQCVYSQNTLTEGQWYHLVARHKSGNLTLWQDGVLQDSITYSGITDTANNLEIGRDSQNPTRFFNGTIDEVMIFNQSLSQQQILALYNNQTDLLVSEETSVGDNWTCEVTPNDGLQNGTTLESNNLTILDSITPPSITNILPIAGTTYNISSPINISATITDTQGIDYTSINVTFPNSTTLQYQLTNYTLNNYSVEFSDLIQKGIYNITFFANDTLGNANTTETTWFERVIPDNETIDIIDENLNYINYTLAVINNVSGIIDIEINLSNSNITQMIIYSHNESSPYSVLKINQNTNISGNYLNQFAIDPSNMHMANMSITINKTNPESDFLWKCENYNFTSDTCIDECSTTLDNCNVSWKYLQNISNVNNYTFTINQTDPIFTETTNNGDALVYEANPTTNYGGLQFLGVRSGSGTNARAYISFDNLSGIPAMQKITDAQACFYYYQQSGTGSRDLSIYHVLDDGFDGQSEATLTWNNQVCGTGFTDSTDCNLTALDTQTITDTTGQFICWNVTSAVKSDYENSDVNVAFAIKDDTEDSGTAYEHRFRSKEFGTAAAHPQLNITYEPLVGEITSLVLNSTNGTNYTTENLTVYTTISDSNSKAIYDWRINNVSKMILNMPFEGLNGNETTIAKDYSTYENNATLGNGTTGTEPTYNATGGVDGFGAYDFDGVNDMITVNNDSEFNITGEGEGFSIFAWINPNQVNNYNRIVAKSHTSNSPPYTIYGLMFDDSQHLRVEFAKSGIQNSFNGQTTINTSQWQLVGFTYNGQDVRIYLNGEEDANGTFEGPIDTNEMPLTIGASGFNNDYFNGTIDGVYIFDKAISPGQIQQLYSGDVDTVIPTCTTVGENWTVEATPNNGYYEGSSNLSNQVEILTEDEIAPTIILNAPANDSETNFSSVLFNWTAINSDPVMTCDLRVDGKIKALGVSSSNNTATTRTINYLKFNQNHTWNVTCEDQHNNINTSETRIFTVTNLLPTQDSPILNLSVEKDLVCNIINTQDGNSDSIKNITQFYVNETPFVFMDMPFENDNFKQRTTVIDYTSGNNGTLVSTTWNSTGGYDGFGAYEFDASDDYISFPTTNFSDLMTFTAWIKPYNNSLANAAIIANKAGGGESGFFLWLNNYNSTNADLEFSRGDGTGSQSDSIDGQITWGEWQHIAFTYNNTDGTAHLYYNGQDLTTNNFGAESGINMSKPFFIGAHTALGSKYNGSIDDVKIYKRILTQEQIQKLYENKTNEIAFNETNRGENWTCENLLTDTKQTNSLATSNNLIVPNKVPLHSTPILNSTNMTSNDTNQNLTCYNQSTFDYEGDSIKNIYNWKINNQPFMILNMPFEGGSNSTFTKDYSGFDNNAVSIDGNTYWNSTAGYDGFGAYEFDGTDDYITIADDSTLEDMSQLTIALWVKDTSGDANPRGLVSKRVSFNSNEVYSLFMYTGRNLYFDTPDSGDRDNSVYSLPTNEWHHVAVTFDGTDSNASNRKKFYIDGALDSTHASTATSLPSTNSNLTIGSLNENYGNSWQGQVDEVLIFNKTLSPEQIQAIYNNQTNLIVNQETSVGEDWTCEVTPNDIYDNGNTLSSNNLTILAGANEAPIITSVSSIANTNPIEASSTPIEFYVTVSDTNGVGDINDSSIKANFTRPGQPTRENLSCNHIADISGSEANYSCTINMWYFDEAGDWNVSVYAEDNDGLSATNTSTSFQYNQLQAITINPNNINFSVSSGATNQLANNDPITINNTGNANLTDSIAVNAINLLGETNPNEKINAENFSSNVADNCLGDQLQNATDVNITGIILEAGNLSLGGGTAQEQLYFCLNEVGSISTQTYSTDQGGAWTIKIVLSLALVTTSSKSKKKKKKRKSKKKKRQVLIEDLSLPITIFTNKLGGLEGLTKYLKENLEMTYHEIAELLNRDDRTIWTSYNKAMKKQPTKILSRKTLVHIPTSIFKNRKYTILEAIVVYLKDKGMKYVEIARLLNRDQRNIWTIYSRASKK